MTLRRVMNGQRHLPSSYKVTYCPFEGRKNTDTYTRDEFRTLLQRAVGRSRSIAQSDIAEQLPEGEIIVVDAFGRGRQQSSMEEAVSYLYRDGTFPRVIVVGIRGVVDGKTLIVLAPSGHTYVSDRAATWNHPPEFGPFNCVGLMVHGAIWKRPHPLSLWDLEEAAAYWKEQSKI